MVWIQNIKVLLTATIVEIHLSCLSPIYLQPKISEKWEGNRDQVKSIQQPTPATSSPTQNETLFSLDIKCFEGNKDFVFFQEASVKWFLLRKNVI